MSGLSSTKTTYGSDPKYYDHVACFMGGLGLNYNDRAGVIDFTGAVYPGLTLRQMSYRVPDHLGVGAVGQILAEPGGQVDGGVVFAEARGGGRFALSLSKGCSFVKAPLSGIMEASISSGNRESWRGGWHLASPVNNMRARRNSRKIEFTKTVLASLFLA